MDMEPTKKPTPTAPRLGRDALVAAICGAGGGADGRRVLRRRAVLQLVLPRHRLQRHHAGRDLGAISRAAGAQDRGAFRFQCRAPGCRGNSSRKQTEIEVKIGQVVTVYYNVTNQSARTTTGQAAYNVAPLTVGAYFQKINCFCFTEQTMAPGEKREMPVVFYVDPSHRQGQRQ